MIDELVFDPDSITVAPGDTVVWENVGEIGHSVTAYEDEIPDAARRRAETRGGRWRRCGSSPVTPGA